MRLKNALAILTLFAAGCGGGNGGGDPAPANPTAIASITVAPGQVTLVRGETVQLDATARNHAGDVLQGHSITWRSLDTDSASVTPGGLVRALRAGNVVINASAGGKTAAAQVIVNDPPAVVSRVELEPFDDRLEEGNRLQLRATALDATGQVILGRGERWSAGAGGVLDVDPSGRVTALRAGVSTVSVRIDGQEASATLSVFANYPYDLAFEVADLGAHGEMFAMDLRDPSAIALPVFPVGRHAADAVAAPQGDRIAFVVHGGWDEGNWQSMIFVANRDGSGARRLTYLPARNQSPSWSPDGSRIVFASQPAGARSDIWVVDADGSGLRKLTADHEDSSQAAPAWSPAMPGGERIAYTRRVDGVGSLWSMALDGSDKRAVTANPDFDDDESAWSPDGQKLVFRRSGPAVFSDLHVVASTGGAGQALMPQLALPFEQLAPAWSPDGKMIAFVSHHGGSEHPQIWTVWADGTRVVQRSSEDRVHSNPSWMNRD